MSHHIWHLVLLALLILSAASAQCQILPFKTYSVKDGLPSNDIEAISQDSYGRMWFGTTEGISIFDGRTFTNYTTRDGLPGNLVTQILPDRRQPGVVWIVTGGGLCRFDNDSITPVYLNAGTVISIHQDSHGTLWCGTNVGVFIIDADSVARFRQRELNDQIERIAEVGDSVLWFSYGSLLISYSRTTGRFNKVDCKAYGDGYLWNLFVDRTGSLYAMMGDHVCVMIRDGIVVANRRNPTSPISVSEDNNGDLWFGSYGGVSRISSGEFGHAPFQLFTTMNGLPENTIRCIYVDREQNIWIGGRDRGIARLSTGANMKFPLGYLWYWHHRRIAVADRSSHLWIVSDQDLLEVWRDRFQIWHSSRHFLYNGVVSRLRHNNGAVGGVTLDGLNRLWITRAGNAGWVVECYEIVSANDSVLVENQPSEIKRIKAISLRNTVLEKGIFPIIEARTGEIWIAGHGIVRIDPAGENPIVRTYDASDDVPDNYIRELYEDRQGNIWAGSFEDGAVKITPDGRIRRYTKSDGLPGNGVWSFVEDGGGRLLIGTSSGGLAILDGDSVSVLSQREGLPSNNVACATRDSYGRLWLGTTSGVICEDRPGSRSFIKNRSLNGLNTVCAGTTRSGLLWFITPTDLLIYDYVHDRKDTIQPPVYITQLRVNGVNRTIQPTMELLHSETNYEIGFAGISFKDENGIRYWYRLNGADTNWRGPTYNRSVTYGHLDPGMYTFQVKAINVDGTESAKPATFAFTILSPYWKTWWFRVAVIIAGLSIFLLIYARRASGLNNARLVQEEFSRQLIESQEAERKRVAGELHDGLGQYFLVILSRAKMALRYSPPEAVTVDLREIVTTAQQGINDVREVAFGLSPYDLERFGLASSIETMLKRMTAISNVRYTAELANLNTVFADRVRIHVYRIVQECLSNVVKHAQASHVLVAAEGVDGKMRIIIRDDGIGFNPDRIPDRETTRRGFGLAGLKERARLLNGSYEIESSPGMGTTTIITIPLRVTGGNKQFHGSGT